MMGDNPERSLRGFRKSDESEVVREIADLFEIDARFLAALRETENGRAGREYGVLSVKAETYEEQAEIAARTIKNTLARYERDTGIPARGAGGRYTESFILYFSHGGPSYPGYAPLGAANDPTHLNAHHARNLSAAYQRIEYA